MLDNASSPAKSLVVEDEAPLLTMLRYNLEKQGFRVEGATDGQEALTRIAEQQPDLVLLDWAFYGHRQGDYCRFWQNRCGPWCD